MPRRILFSDLHGNLEALERLVKHAAGKLLSVGDVLGPQGQSGENLACLRLLRELGIPSVLGNHDTSLFSHYRPGLEPWAEEYLATWPLEFCDETALVTHTLRDKSGACIEFLPLDRPERVKQLLDRRPRVFAGHLHLPGYWTWQTDPEQIIWKPVLEPTTVQLRREFRYLFQVGSLGEPLGPRLPRYLVWEDEHVEWLRLPPD